jgi:hypothetical protein
MIMGSLLLEFLRTINDILTAGIAITAFSLLVYALSLNLRDRVTRSFVIILGCVVVVFVGEALGSVAQTAEQQVFWLRFQWLGLIFLPSGYLQFSDALLATTGRPSRGRRRFFVRLAYVLSFIFLVTLPFPLLVGDLVQVTAPVPHFQRTWFTWVFTSCYALGIGFSFYNLWRAFQRTVTSASRRRMFYLMVGALGPALGCYPFLIFGFGIASNYPLIFWLAVTFSNLLVSAMLVLMAYAVAFFGVSWPDRVVRRRLLKWVMRGPVTASAVLGITTFVRRLSAPLGIDASAAIAVIMVATILIFEHLITLAAPRWERWLFRKNDRADLEMLQALEERLLTLGDLQQFLEAILAAVCDRLQAPTAFLAYLGNQGLEMLVTIGGDQSLEGEDLSENLLQAVTLNGSGVGMFTWGDFRLVPLYEQEEEGRNLLGLLGVKYPNNKFLEEEGYEALAILADRAALALIDHHRQQQVFSSLEALSPQIEMIQRLRAASRYDSTEVLAQSDMSLEQEHLSPWVKDALSHYWGGPKLTQSPLLDLQVVQQSVKESGENPTNALRAILRKAIDQVRPEGDRRFTGEWILYNILEMKFMEGRKVREIAKRLAMSEADLYRKQRVAIEAVAKIIVEMEYQTRDELSIVIENENQTEESHKTRSV